jgi:hypothetical protein
MLDGSYEGPQKCVDAATADAVPGVLAVIMTEDENAELKRIEEKILSFCEAATADGRPYLLSDLGKSLGDDLRRLKILFNGKLADFLRERLPKTLLIAAIGPHSNILSVIPAGPDVETMTGDLAGRNPRPTQATTSAAPRFHYKFWAAFSVPPANGRRLLNLATLVFRDTDDEALSSEVEVPRTLIPPADALNRDHLISENISNWLQTNGLQKEKFLASTKSEHQTGDYINRGTTLLELVISALDHRQLQSISLPLDAVSALLRKRV